MHAVIPESVEPKFLMDGKSKRKSILLLWSDLPSLKLTVRPWKLMVGILLSYWGLAIFRGEPLVSGRVSLHILWRIFHFKGLPPEPSCDVIQTPSRLGAWSSSHGLGELRDILEKYPHICSYHNDILYTFLINPYQSLSILPISVETNWDSSMIVAVCSLSSTKYGRRTHPKRRETTHTSSLHHGSSILGPLWHPEKKLRVVFICHLLLLNTLWG